VFASAGFSDVAITARFDCFAGPTKERTARRYGVVGVNLRATRGDNCVVWSDPERKAFSTCL
jgi:hypothetical protein